jgi:hypothetical protein
MPINSPSLVIDDPGPTITIAQLYCQGYVRSGDRIDESNLT